MDYLTSLNLKIKEIELKINLNDFEVNGINLWPLIRSEYYQQNFRQNFGLKNKLNLKSFYYHVRNFLKILDLVRLKNINLFLLYGSDKSGKLCVNNKTIDKHFSPFEIEYGKNQTIKIEYGKIDPSFPKSNSINISLLFFLWKSIFKIFYKKKFKSKIEIVNRNLYKIGISIKGLSDKIIEFFLLMAFFNFILRVNKPKKVFVKSFDNLISFSLIASANKRGIETVEYQHGQQGENSLRYTNWNNVPKNGFTLIPKTFWIWDKIFEKKFLQWIPKQNYHKIFIGENLWFKYLHKYISPKKTNLDTNKIMVLICLQFSKVPNILLEAMKISQNIIWLVRLHPREQHMIDNVAKSLKSNGIDMQYVDMKYSNKYLLEEIIPNVSVVISGFSTVLYESFYLGKKAITINDEGKKAYSEFIKKKYIKYCSNSSELVKMINEI